MQLKPVIRILILGLIVIATIPSFAQLQTNSIPDWIKGVAGWWSEGKISDQEFMNGIEYLINTGAIKPKIVQEQQTKIQDLEARLAAYNNTQTVVTYLELRESTQKWIDGKITDTEYYQSLQHLVDNGILGPFTSSQNQNMPESDKAAFIEEYKSLAAAWLNNGYDDFYFIPEVEGFYQIGVIDNPDNYVVPVPEQPQTPEKTALEVAQEKQNIIDSSHKQMFDNAKSWIDGSISRDTYIQKIVGFAQDGVFNPVGRFLPNPQYIKHVFTNDATKKILANESKLEQLHSITTTFVTSEPQYNAIITKCKQDYPQSTCQGGADSLYFHSLYDLFYQNQS